MTKEISSEEVAQRLSNNEDLSIIDVRESFELVFGKIPGAKSIPLGELAARKDELDKNKKHIIVCQSGNRSKAACGLLENDKFNVVNMVGGMNEWQGPTT